MSGGAQVDKQVRGRAHAEGPRLRAQRPAVVREQVRFADRQLHRAPRESSRMLRVERGSASRLRAGRRSRLAMRRGTPAPTRASGSGRRSSSRSASARSASSRSASTSASRLHAAERHRSITLKDGLFEDGNRLTTAPVVAYRILEAVDLVAETYATYLLCGDSASAVKLSNEVVGGIKIFVERNSYLMLGAGAALHAGFEAADLARVHRLHLRAVDRRPRRRRHQGRRRQVPRRAGGLRRLPGRRRLPRSGQRQRRHPRRGRPLPERARGPRRRSGRGRLPRGHRRRPRRRRHPRLEGQVPRRARGQATASRTTTAAPIPTTTRTASPTRRIAARTIPRTRTASRTRTAAPIRTTTRTASPTSNDKCPNEPETYNGFQDEDGCPDKGNVIIAGQRHPHPARRSSSRRAAPRSCPSRTRSSTRSATTLKHHPEFTLIEVAGSRRRARDRRLQPAPHAGSREHAWWRRSSQRKVAQDRLRRKGYGEYLPARIRATTKAAWEKNRRVEFKIVKTKDGPTGVELGCANAASKGVKPDPVP